MLHLKALFGGFYPQATGHLRACKYPCKMSLLVISNGDILVETVASLNLPYIFFPSLRDTECRNNYTTEKQCYSGMPIIHRFFFFFLSFIASSANTHLEAWFSYACTSLHLSETNTICQVTIKEPHWLFKTIQLHLVNTYTAQLLNTWPMHTCLIWTYFCGIDIIFY